jgi:hypothetical protein
LLDQRSDHLPVLIICVERMLHYNIFQSIPCSSILMRFSRVHVPVL